MKALAQRTLKRQGRLPDNQTDKGKGRPPSRPFLLYYAKKTGSIIHQISVAFILEASLDFLKLVQQLNVKQNNVPEPPRTIFVLFVP